MYWKCRRKRKTKEKWQTFWFRGRNNDTG